MHKEFKAYLLTGELVDIIEIEGYKDTKNHLFLKNMEIFGQLDNIFQ